MKDPKIAEKWNKVLKLLAPPTVTETAYNTWFKSLTPKYTDEDTGTFCLSTQIPLVYERVSARYLPLLEEKTSEALGKSYRVVIECEDKDQAKKKKAHKPAFVKTDDGRLTQEFYLNPKYNFSSFVISDSNRYAHAAAFAVAEEPARAYNPLFIYGGSGLGKTHLMHAIGHYILENHPKLSVLYVSSEMFTNELIKAIGENKMPAFREKYRHIDVLLIDDIQFFEGKEKTQDEFFHTFNTLYDSNKQLVITSDRPPSKLVNIEERLRSRFQMNVIADISKPDYETRVAILRKKAEQENIELTDDLNEVIALISSKEKNNIRELEGAFIRVISFSNLLGKKVDVNFARSILKDVLEDSGVSITPDTIKRHVCKYFNIKQQDLDSKKRSRDIAYPRQIAMYLCKTLADCSYPKIGEAFGRDHTTVLYAYEKIAEEIEKNPSVKETVENIEELITAKQ